MREEKFLDLTLAIDSLTGASPSGAMPAGAVQTFTNPSGNAQYTIAPGEQALDPSFLDTRTALSANWEMPVGRLSLLSVGASLSDEYDYTHTGVNARLARDFNNRNTTLSFGVALANDTIDPVGGSPAPFTPMRAVMSGPSVTTVGSGPKQRKFSMVTDSMCIATPSCLVGDREWPCRGRTPGRQNSPSGPSIRTPRCGQSCRTVTPRKGHSGDRTPFWSSTRIPHR